MFPEPTMPGILITHHLHIPRSAATSAVLGAGISLYVKCSAQIRLLIWEESKCLLPAIYKLARKEHGFPSGTGRRCTFMYLSNLNHQMSCVPDAIEKFSVLSQLSAFGMLDKC